VAGDDGWLVGRVKNYDAATYPLIDYVVRFPNGRVMDLSEDRLRVRVFEPHADPADVLAAGGGESQFLHDRRWGALATSVRLRAAAQGLTGALSSKIELVPHQLAAARRVLTDPIPRYLLADEVGMGKTIEAGIVARQCLIDDPTRRIEILAPRPLVEQWQSELLSRCGLSDFPDAAVVRAYEDLEAIEAAPDMLIVDEAHNLLERPADRERLTQLAHGAPRLLLLSATPALGSPRALLDLLHLLDPAAYGIDDLSKLEHRLALSRDLGRLLLTLKEDAPALLVKRSVQALAARVPEDHVVAKIATRIVANEAAPDEFIDLRQHLADTYRVHQRLVRSRRSDAAVYFQPRGILKEGRRDHLREEVDEDRRWPDILASLEDLREELSSAAETPEAVDARASQYIRLLDEVGIEPLPRRLDTSAGLQEALDGDPGPRDRYDVASDVLRAWVRRLKQEGERAPKIVAFTSRMESAVRLHDALTREEQGAILLAENLQPADARSRITSFQTDSTQPILVCDRSGEEGLNLSFVDAILHFELPFSVSRMEQRIGRLDRFGRSKRLVRQRVLLPSDDDASPWLAWLEVLRDGFGIFETSTSDVQFILPELEADLAQALFRGGANGLRSMVSEVRERLNAARRAADEQYALDAFALGDDAKALVDGIEEVEEDEQTIQASVEGWLVGALSFRPTKHDDEVRYTWTRDTLVPRRPWEEEFAIGLGQASTWRRRVALRRNLPLLRPGSRLLDVMERHLRWDDRGSAFATWRIDPSVEGDDIAWIGFRLCFVVEPQLEQDLAVFSQSDAQGLTRRAQRFLPPYTAVIHVDADGNPPPEWLVEVLERRYEKEPRPQGGRDINLSSRPELLARVISPASFAKLCCSVRDRAEQTIREMPDYRSRIAEALRHAQIDERRRVRLVAGTGAESAARVTDAVRTPRLRVDSMGFFVVSRTPPRAA
jgi:ATP-dependent helicase HepA